MPLVTFNLKNQPFLIIMITVPFISIYIAIARRRKCHDHQISGVSQVDMIIAIEPALLCRSGVMQKVGVD